MNPEKLERIREKYKNGVTNEILAEFSESMGIEFLDKFSSLLYGNKKEEDENDKGAASQCNKEFA